MSFVSLISSEGQCFRVDKSIAQQSLTVSRLLEAFATNESEEINDDTEIPIGNVSSRTLEKIIEWCADQHEITAEACGQRGEIVCEMWRRLPAFRTPMHNLQITNEDLFDLITAANYLYMDELLDMCCKRVADMIKNKSPVDIRKTFGIVNDLALEYEEQIRNETAFFDYAFPSVTYEFEVTDSVFRLFDFPNEIISIVFQQLDIVDRLRARVCKRLYQIEQQGKYHIKRLDLIFDTRTDVHSLSTIRPEKLVILLRHFDVNVSFDVIMDRYIALLQKISRNTIVDNLTMSIFHLDYEQLVPYVNSIPSRELTIYNTGTHQLNVNKDSMNDFTTRGRETLRLPGTKLTGLALVRLYDDIANSKITLRRFRVYAKTRTLFYFLKNIGITLVDNQFASTRADLRIIVEVFRLFGSKYFFLIGNNMIIIADGDVMQYNDGKLWMERHDNRGPLTDLLCSRQDIPFNSDPLTTVFSYRILNGCSSYYSCLSIRKLD